MEEVFIALSSGLLSAVIALIGSHLVSKRSATIQMKTAVLNSFLTARLDAYKELELAISLWSERRDASSCEVEKVLNRAKDYHGSYLSQGEINQEFYYAAPFSFGRCRALGCRPWVNLWYYNNP